MKGVWPIDFGACYEAHLLIPTVWHLVDLKFRKAAPFPPEVCARMDAQLAARVALDWLPPVCGAMRPENHKPYE